jgi:drug/metabolite transporter (DMT)-like permease
LVVVGTIIVILVSREKKTKGTSAENVGANYSKLMTGVLLALTTSGMWAMNAFATSHAAQAPVMAANSIRMLIALLLAPLIGFVFFKSRTLIVARDDLKKLYPLFIIEAFGGSLFYVYGVSNTTLALGAVLTSLAPVIAVPLDAFRHRRRPQIKQLIAVCLAVGGLWILIFSKSSAN